MSVRLRQPSLLLFGSTAVGYLLVAATLQIGFKIVPADSLARIAIAERVLFSHDPHLAAIGFVWNPLQIVPLIPLVAFKVIWPDLAKLGFAAAIPSALFMAGAVYQLYVIFREFGLYPVARIGLTILFAIHPMIVYFAANGMSEAMLTFFLLVAVRQLVVWFRGLETRPLAFAGLALAAAYLARYEALAPAGAAVLLVSVVSFVRSRHRADRLAVVTCDAIVIGLPVVGAFVFWALASWLIVGHPFEPLTSTYGNNAYVQTIRHQSVPVAVEYAHGAVPATLIALRRMLILEPVFLLLLFAGAVQAIRRRAANLAAPLAIFGAVLCFMLVAYLEGILIGDLRYFIAVVPAATLVMGALMPKAPSNDAASRRAVARRSSRWSAASVAATAALLAAAGTAVPVAAAGMTSLDLAPSQSDELKPLIGVVEHPGARQPPSYRNLTERAVARTIDSLHPGPGKVLIDVVVGYAIVLYTRDQTQFVIPSDRDWRVALSAPQANGIEYFLVPDPTKYLSALDEINRTYPGAYQNGGGLGQLVESFNGVGGSPTWRLYRVTAAAGVNGP